MSIWHTKRELRDYQLRMCLYGRPRAPNGWGGIKGDWGRPPAPRVEVSRPIWLATAVANRLDWPLLPGGHQTLYPTITNPNTMLHHGNTRDCHVTRDVMGS